MKFRTEIGKVDIPVEIRHSVPLLMLGSCFTAEIGAKLNMDGFDVMYNPFGALYNPCSIANCLQRALAGVPYGDNDLREGPRGWHCLDYSTVFSGADRNSVIEAIEKTRSDMAAQLQRKPVVFLTLGTSFVFEEKTTGRVVGNCHKFPASYFTRRRLELSEIIEVLSKCVELLIDAGVNEIVFTVSPIRHTADGLHGNMLSKSLLLLAVEEMCCKFPHKVYYFPAFEILYDDLRDYRFYDSDMKHPSEVAVDYIYSIFSETFFSSETRERAGIARRKYLASQHRPIL